MHLDIEGESAVCRGRRSDRTSTSGVTGRGAVHPALRSAARIRHGPRHRAALAMLAHVNGVAITPDPHSAGIHSADADICAASDRSNRCRREPRDAGRRRSAGPASPGGDRINTAPTCIGLETSSAVIIAASRDPAVSSSSSATKQSGRAAGGVSRSPDCCSAALTRTAAPVVSGRSRYDRLGTRRFPVYPSAPRGGSPARVDARADQRRRRR